MRVDLEAAMGHVITSHVARDDFLEDPLAFAAEYDLDATETSSLLAMRDDLAELTPQFVAKRQRMLTGSYPRTLGLLDAETAANLVEDYLEESAPIDPAQDDQRRFGEFLCEETATLAASTEAGDVVADMARFELLYQGVFWAATSPALSAPAAAAGSFDPDRPLRLQGTAAIGHFGWDFRLMKEFRPEIRKRLRPDPCHLLLFHTGQPRGHRVIRLQADQVAALQVVRDHPRGVSAVEACLGQPSTVSPSALLGRIFAQGALVWA